MKFALVKTSLVDYPGCLAAALFTCGCNLRCPYCHNPDLVNAEAVADMMDAEEVLRFLRMRRKVLEGVCVSGGEPLLQPHLSDFIREVRLMGYRVKIDTNGLLPEVLKSLQADYIALDIKTLPEKYAALLAPPCAAAGEADMAAALRESARYIIHSGIDHELRSIAAPGVFLEEDIPLLAELVRGCRRYILAAMRPGLTLDPAYGKTRAPYPEGALARMRQAFRDRGVECFLRGM
jgi:pyruvate formate lyase activating enzyme